MSQSEPGISYTANQMNEFIGSNHQGGIPYSGHFPELQRIGVILGGGGDAIYDDRMASGSIRYIGEGQVGDQQLTSGNRALVWGVLS